MEDKSETSRGTNYSTRAHSLLEQIRLNTSYETHQEFLKTLSLFKRRKIDTEACQERVKFILKNHPDLLLLFEECLPGKREGSLNQFDSALTFVNKVRNRYQNDPNTYNTFLGLLRDYQRGGRAQEDVSLAVTWLLREQPDLVLEFSKFCNAGQGLKNSDSNETLGPIEENTPLLDERVDLESQAPKRRYKKVYITFGLICVILAALAILYHFGFLQEFIKLIGQ